MAITEKTRVATLLVSFFYSDCNLVRTHEVLRWYAILLSMHPLVSTFNDLACGKYFLSAYFSSILRGKSALNSCFFTYVCMWNYGIGKDFLNEQLQIFFCKRSDSFSFFSKSIFSMLLVSKWPLPWQLCLFTHFCVILWKSGVIDFPCIYLLYMHVENTWCRW